MATTEYTDAEMLTLVRAAIVAVLKKQSYRIGEIEYTFANLPALQSLEKSFSARVARASSGYGRTLGAFE